MPYPTPLLDKAIANRRQQNEQQRLIMIEQVIRWLESKAQNYGITQAYLFGSVVRPYGFGRYSDIDLALEMIDPNYFFQAMAKLSERVGRDVDLVELSKCSFGDRIRQQGLLWKPQV
jgi:predicted nucleotidyltransferase